MTKIAYKILENKALRMAQFYFGPADLGIGRAGLKGGLGGEGRRMRKIACLLQLWPNPRRRPRSFRGEAGKGSQAFFPPGAALGLCRNPANPPRPFLHPAARWRERKTSKKKAAFPSKKKPRASKIGGKLAEYQNFIMK